jgi:ankyrin repeat protein
MMSVHDLKAVFNKIMEHTDYFDGNANDMELTDVNQKNWAGDSPLQIIVRLGDIAAIHLLIEHGANVNDVGEMNATALHYAVMKNNIHVIDILLGYGADPYIKDINGRTPIDWAITSGNNEIVSALKKVS